MPCLMPIQINMIPYIHVENRHLHDINIILCLYLGFDALPQTKAKPMHTSQEACNVHLHVQVSQALDQLCKVEEAKT